MDANNYYTPQHDNLFSAGNQNSRFFPQQRNSFAPGYNLSQSSESSQPNWGDFKFVPSEKQSFATPTNRLYSQYKNTAQKILDAPYVVNDYYMNLLSFGANGVLAVALAHEVYLWNELTQSIATLDLKSKSTVCSVSWMEGGSHIALGNDENLIKIYDVELGKTVMTLKGHGAKVQSLAWNSSVLASGDRNGLIIQQDVRVQQHFLKWKAHSMGVCGLRWDPEGVRFASGSDDATVCIWGMNSSPLSTFTDHKAAVKGLAWCPWQKNTLATGAGSADSTIRLWNVNNSRWFKKINTQSQVTALDFDSDSQQLLSAHGHPCAKLKLWDFNNMETVAEFVGHEGRILNVAVSPVTKTVVSIASDETLRTWDIFENVDEDWKFLDKLEEGSSLGSSIARQAVNINIREDLRQIFM